MKQVTLYIAMSLDGYIADRNGGVDWLVGQEIPLKLLETQSYNGMVECIYEKR